VGQRAFLSVFPAVAPVRAGKSVQTESTPEAFRLGSSGQRLVAVRSQNRDVAHRQESGRIHRGLLSGWKKTNLAISASSTSDAYGFRRVLETGVEERRRLARCDLEFTSGLLQRHGGALHFGYGGPSAMDIQDAEEIIRSEYMEMPGLRLTFWQAQRLWNLSEERCERALNTLIATGFLVQNGDACYTRPASPTTTPTRRRGRSRRNHGRAM
jgi:hypothetical protein